MSDIFYLQRSDSTDKLILDSTVFNIDFSVPNRKIGVRNAIGNNGGRYTDMESLDNRKFKYQFKFRKEQNTTALDTQRANFINFWVFQPRGVDLFLYYYIPSISRTYKIQVKSKIMNEKYASYQISNTVDVMLIAEKSYFDDTTLTTQNETITGASEQSFDIDNILDIAKDAGETPFVLKFTPTNAFNSLIFYSSFDNYFKITRSFNAGELIEVDTGTGIVKVNDVVIESAYTSGSPFNLQSGTNTMYFTGEAGNLDIEYYKRVL